MILGYLRESTIVKNSTKLKVLMTELGADDIFIDENNGMNANRPELQKMFLDARKGDTVICQCVADFASNTNDFLDLIEQLKAKGVAFISKKESIDTNTSTGQLMLSLIGAMVELDRKYNLNRQREGTAHAKNNST